MGGPRAGPIRGPTEAPEDLFGDHRERIWRYFLRMAKDPDTADDLIQKLSEKMYGVHRRHNLLDRMDNPKAYLARSAKSVWIDWLRAKKRDRLKFCPSDELPEIASCHKINYETIRFDNLEVIEVIRKKLCPADQDVLNKILHGWGYRKIAKELTKIYPNEIRNKSCVEEVVKKIRDLCAQAAGSNHPADSKG